MLRKVELRRKVPDIFKKVTITTWDSVRKFSPGPPNMSTF